MPLMKLAKNRVYASTLGHVIRFVKDEPVFVHPIMLKECGAIGAVVVPGKAPKVKKKPMKTEEQMIEEINTSVNAVKEAEGIPEAPAQPVAPVDRMEMILSCVRALIERNERGDFTAAGIPNLNVLGKKTGFRVDKNELKEAMATINDPE